MVLQSSFSVHQRSIYICTHLGKLIHIYPMLTYACRLTLCIGFNSPKKSLACVLVDCQNGHFPLRSTRGKPHRVLIACCLSNSTATARCHCRYDPGVETHKINVSLSISQVTPPSPTLPNYFCKCQQTVMHRSLIDVAFLNP